VIIVFIFLYFLVALKLCALINAVRWILLHGSEYQDRVSGGSAISARERDQVLDSCAGGFFPFGVKDYRLSRYLRSPDCKGAKKLAVGFFRKYLFQFPGPAFTGAALLVITAKFRPTVTLVSGDTYSWVGAGYGVLLLVVIITFAIEAFLSYAILGSYGIAWHRLDVPRERWWSTARRRPRPDPRKTEPIVIEMTAYGGILITGYTAMSSTVYFVAVRLGGFAAIPASHGSAFVQLDSLLDSLYWTVVVPTDFNGAGPVGAFPRLIALLGFIAAFILITFVVFGLGVAIAAVRKPPQAGSGANDTAIGLTSLAPVNSVRQAAGAAPGKRARRRRKRRRPR
jgi:hypothetical protein